MFVVVGYPRSRTRWLSRFLTDDKISCLHEPLTLTRQDLYDFIKCGNGVSDSHLIMSIDDIIKCIPNVKIILIKRPRIEVVESLMNIGLALNVETMDKIDDIINDLQSKPNVLTVDYKDINKHHKEIYEFAMGYECPEEKSKLININIQYSKEELLQIIIRKHMEV